MEQLTAHMGRVEGALGEAQRVALRASEERELAVTELTALRATAAVWEQQTSGVVAEAAQLRAQSERLREQLWEARQRCDEHLTACCCCCCCCSCCCCSCSHAHTPCSHERM